MVYLVEVALNSGQFPLVLDQPLDNIIDQWRSLELCVEVELVHDGGGESGQI